MRAAQVNENILADSMLCCGQLERQLGAKALRELTRCINHRRGIAIQLSAQTFQRELLRGEFLKGQSLYARVSIAVQSFQADFRAGAVDALQR